VLTASTLLSAILIYTTYQKFSAKSERVVFILAFILIFTIVHHAYFLFRLLVTARSRRSSPAWPATPLFVGKRERCAYVYGIMFLCELYIINLPRFVEDGSWVFWREGPIELLMGSCYVLLTVTLAAGWFSSFKMYKAEARAGCLQGGHDWKCIRLCYPDKEANQQTTAAADVEVLFDEKDEKASTLSSSRRHLYRRADPLCRRSLWLKSYIFQVPKVSIRRPRRSYDSLSTRTDVGILHVQ
jgi:hypothetical protein